MNTLKEERRSKAIAAVAGNGLEAAVINERMTRQRVANIEAWLIAWTTLSLWKRLRWLIKGVQ